MNVFILNRFEGAARSLLFDRLSQKVRMDEGPDLPKAPSYEVLVAGRPERSHLEASPNLHSLVIPFAGLPEVTRNLLKSFPEIAVYNLHHNAAPTAEMALALLLGAAKFLLPFDQSFRRHDWQMRYEASPAVLLAGKSALILGYGQIGQRVGRVLKALGMQVRAVRRSLNQPVLEGAECEIFPIEALTQLLPSAEVLVVTLPLTPLTEGLLGDKELGLLPEGCILVNVGRGPVIQSGPLFDRLKSGYLAGAGLDVWYHYPQNPQERVFLPPADEPFHELENVVMSPHRAGHVRETELLRASSLADLLNQLAEGRSILPLDPNRGY